jgi:hypothetical protein
MQTRLRSQLIRPKNDNNKIGVNNKKIGEVVVVAVFSVPIKVAASLFIPVICVKLLLCWRVQHLKII